MRLEAESAPAAPAGVERRAPVIAGREAPMTRLHNTLIIHTVASMCAAAALLAGCAAAEAIDPDEAEEIGAADQAIAGAMPFGTMCQADFQNGWQTTLGNTWNRCAGFNNKFNQIATQNFYYNLGGAKPYWETPLDAYVVDSVSFFYTSTHGGAWSDGAVYAMWDQGSLANTKNMRLDTMSIFSGYACKTLTLDDKLVTRWFPPMAGGLHIVAGSHGYVYDSWYTDDVGTDYADDLSHQWSVKDSWIDGLWDAYTSQDVALVSAGTNADDCYWRLNGISVYNYVGFPRRHDWEIGALCWAALTE
jgi:hypothetical protein